MFFMQAECLAVEEVVDLGDTFCQHGF